MCHILMYKNTQVSDTRFITVHALCIGHVAPSIALPRVALSPAYTLNSQGDHQK